jgi:hypothetical protein
VWSTGSEGLPTEFGEAFLAGGLVGHVMHDVVLSAGHTEEVGELVDHSRIAGSWQMLLVSTFSCSRISRQASAIDIATPLGLQAPGLMITSACGSGCHGSVLFQT